MNIHRPWRPPAPAMRVWALLAGLLIAVGLLGFTATTASATGLPAAQTRVGASASTLRVLVGPSADVSPAQGRVDGPPRPGFVVATGVAANAGSGADNVVNGVRLRAQLTGEEISGGHAFQKHVIDQAEFPGMTTRSQFAAHIEDVVANGEMRSLGGGRTAYWRDGAIVIRNPKAADGGTALRPRDGYDYFLNVP